MPVFEQVPIRLQISLTSNPPVAPIDANTDLPPRLWRANTIALQCGIFDPNGDPVDLSNLEYVDVVLQLEESSVIPLVTKQIDAAEITDVITIGGWRGGTAQNFTAVFTAAETDQGLDAGQEKTFWLIVRGVLESGAPIIYAAGPVTIYNPGSSLPLSMRASVSRGVQTTAAGNVTITPTSNLHTEIVTVEGAARDFDVLLGIAGVSDGAKLFLTLILPETPDINIAVKNALSANPAISNISTGTVLKAYLQYYFDADESAWVPELYMLPPT